LIRSALPYLITSTYAINRPLRDEFPEEVWEPTGEIPEQGNMEKGIKKLVLEFLDKHAARHGT